MAWFKTTLRNSIWSLFGASTQGGQHSTRVSDTVVDMEDVRDRMLQLARRAKGDPQAEKVVKRIRHAYYIEELYFIRAELMAVLARADGEAAALEAIDSVSDMFQDLLPDGLRSRPSPLAPSMRDARGR
jgi:protein-disulfide isomerase-like protein with CxxC motif